MELSGGNINICLVVKIIAWRMNESNNEMDVKLILRFRYFRDGKRKREVQSNDFEFGKNTLMREIFRTMAGRQKNL